MELVILAAGMGSRFGGLKQIEPMDEFGNFIIDYSVYDAIEVGFDTVTFIIKEEIYEEFKNTIGKRIGNRIKVKYAFQKLDDLPKGYKLPKGREKPWGTAHAILAARNVISDNFVIINADDYYGKDAFRVAANYLRNLKPEDEGKYANVAFKVCNTMTENGSVKRGICVVNEQGKLTGMVESSIERINGKIHATPLEDNIAEFDIEDDRLVSMNMFIFTKGFVKKLEERFPEFLDAHKDNELKCEYLIPTVVTELIEEKEVSVELLATSSVWYGVTYKDDKPNVVASLKKLVDEGKYVKGLWK